MTGASLAMSRRCSRSSLASLVQAVGPIAGAARLRRSTVDGVEDFLLGGERGAGPAGRVKRAHRGDGLEIQRIGHREREAVDPSSATGMTRHWRRKRARAPSISGATGGGPSTRDQRHAKLLGERGQHVAQGDEAQVDQDLAELVAALLLQFERALEIFGLDLAALDQDLAEAQVARTRRRAAASRGSGCGGSVAATIVLPFRPRRRRRTRGRPA